jgi:transcriptional regulator with XRE-family HTH domain
VSSIADLIATSRKSKNLTQEQLARIVEDVNENDSRSETTKIHQEKYIKIDM